MRICKTLRGCRDYILRDQIQRASVSVSSNIAEGMERNTKAEYRNFLGIAKGSAGEVRTQLWILRDLGHIGHDDACTMIAECEEISRMLHGLIRSLW